MDKSSKLKKAILENYKSIREFAKVVDIPNSTIVSAIDNGIGGMAVDKVIKMCAVLNLDVKTFDKNELTEKPLLQLGNYSKFDFSQEATEVAQAYEKAEFEKQNIVRLTLGLELKKQSKLIEFPKQEDNFNEEPYEYAQQAAENRSDYLYAAANADKEITQDELNEAVLQTLKASKKHKEK